ncbi:hypothetical protein SAMN05444172_5370 [Burkholderia sp. GAS332]|jgi:hypothetical protein|uniref:PAAR domain-containing protein n=1 Tax=Paraburkholderia TaxID=1822464 RepID=UPI0009298E49|nr:hypothetical protein SAMN05444172_5370 [Burkholderia sp. GAS332]
MKMMAVKGNATTTGGVVLDGDSTFLDVGKGFARHLGLASCGRCGKNGQMLGTAGTLGVGNTRGVCDGDIVMCACPQGTNRVIARSTMYYGE